MNMLTHRARDFDEALKMALEKQGKDTPVLVLRNAADMIPKVR